MITSVKFDPKHIIMCNAQYIPDETTRGETVQYVIGWLSDLTDPNDNWKVSVSVMCLAYMDFQYKSHHILHRRGIKYHTNMYNR